MEIQTTMGIDKKAAGSFQPTSIRELHEKIQNILKNQPHISVSSRGKNWGYGCSAPAKDNSFLIDLSLCSQIKFFDPIHGLITLEPGVTYGQLSEFLKESGDDWLAPVHGGGPHCSVVGNALERGYGITPITDHNSAIMCLKAILKNGEIYEGNLSKIGLRKLDQLFKHGIGPNYDGLFAQSGLGIVTEITFKLAKKPEHVEMFYFNILNSSDLGQVVKAIKKSKQELGSTLAGVNVLNMERCLSMVEPYPPEKVYSAEILNQKDIEKKGKKYQLTPWLVLGTLYGQKNVVKAAKKELKKNFRNINKRSFYYNSQNRFLFRLMKKILTFIKIESLATVIQKMEEAYQVILGVPNNVALRLAYWKHENQNLLNQSNLDPGRDGCGLIWYAPLVEMDPISVQEFVLFIRASAEKFQVDALITLTTVDDLCFDSTIPILFNQNSQTDRLKAIAFYQYILIEGKKLGFFPYRLNIESQQNYDFQTSLFDLKLINPFRYR